MVIRNLMHLIQREPRRERIGYFSICYTVDDEHLVIGRTAGRISIIGTNQPTHTSFIAHENDIKAVRCSKINPNIFYSGDVDGYCKMWDDRVPHSNYKAPLAMSTMSNYSITNIDVDNYDRYLVTTSAAIKFDIWDLRRLSENNLLGMRRREENNPSATPVYLHNAMRITKDDMTALFWQVKFSPPRTGNRYIYSCGNTGYVNIFDIMTGAVVREFRPDYSTVCDCSWHPNENEIVTVTVRLIRSIN
uniref:Uncharacterized protein n=1 Tax=Setaria digitata TaxID=48799 RepID=A0A915Q8B3_9BILA